MRSIWLVIAGALGCGGSPIIAPTSAVLVASGLQLRPLAPEIHLEVTEARAPVIAAFNGDEIAGTFSIAEHATIAEKGVARVEGDKVVAIAPGEAKLHFESELGVVEVPIVVHAAAPTGLVVDGVPPARLGEPVAVKATLSWAEGPSDATYDVTWSTDSPNQLHVPDAITARGWVVSIDKLGNKTTAVLRATYGSLVAETRVAPSNQPITGIEIRMAWSWINRRRFGAFAHYEDGQEREISAGCLWSVEGKSWRAAKGDAPLGPSLRADEVSWQRIATCTIAGVRGSGSLFSP